MVVHVMSVGTGRVGVRKRFGHSPPIVLQSKTKLPGT